MYVFAAFGPSDIFNGRSCNTMGCLFNNLITIKIKLMNPTILSLIVDDMKGRIFQCVTNSPSFSVHPRTFIINNYYASWLRLWVFNTRFLLEFAEPDSFFCFTNLMSEIRDFFIKSLDESDKGINMMMNKLLNQLRNCDLDVWLKFQRLELKPQYYSFR